MRARNSPPLALAFAHRSRLIIASGSTASTFLSLGNRGELKDAKHKMMRNDTRKSAILQKEERKRQLRRRSAVVFAAKVVTGREQILVHSAVAAD